MAEKKKFYVNLSSLISQARLKKGYATLKELYRDKRPEIDYQTWLHAESGRRVPSAAAVISIADILGIDHQSTILAYCKDKFPHEKSHQAIDTLKINKFVDIDTLLDAEEHNRSKEYVFTAAELAEMKKDVRLHLYLNYTYDEDSNTTVQRLAHFFDDSEDNARKVVTQLAKLKLVEVMSDNVKKIHKHTSIPPTPDNFDLRKDLLIKSLGRTVQPDSYMTNYNISITEESYRKVIAFFDFVSANLIKLNKDDANKEGNSRFQITLTGNRLLREDHDSERE